MKNSISRRSFLKAVGALSAAGALAACGGSSSSSTAASSTAASAAASTAAGANIKLWTYPIGGWGKDETVQELISSFNAKYPDIKVTVEYLDYTNGDDQVNTAIEGGSAPDLIMEGPERLVANWGKKGVMAPLNDLWTDDAKKDIYASVESACRNDAGDYYEYPLCMTAHCMAVNMTKVKEVGADQYIDTDKHTWSTDGFLKTVDALYNGGYENVAAIYCSGQGGDQGTRAIINNMYGGTFTDAEHTKYTADSPENIKAIQAESGADINIEEDGTVHIYASKQEGLDRAMELVTRMFKTIEIGELYTGKIVSTTTFGAFMEVLPGKDGLIHISELAEGRTVKTEDVVSVGDVVTAKCIGIDDKGRVKMSIRAALRDAKAAEAEAAGITE